MAEKNIQMKLKSGTVWDDLFPKTKANLITLDDGTTVQQTVSTMLTSLTSKTTIAQVTAEIQKIVGAAPAALDTLKEIADALGQDANFAATITNGLASKVDKVTGKGLSTNDFTAALKTKLEGLTDLSTEVAAKADKATTYTKTEVDTALSSKAAASTTYTKTEVDTKVATGYTKTEANSLLAAKAPQSTTYTKTEVDTRINNLQANAIPVSATEPVGASVWFQDIT